MWEKSTRYSVFSAIYELLFRREQDLPTQDADWKFIIENSKFEDVPDSLFLNKVMSVFANKEPEYTITLEKYLKNWDKTYPIVKACLFSFMLESEPNLQGQLAIDTDKDLITKYIRLSEDHIGGQNVGLVHAVLSKINAESKEQ